MIDSHCHLDFKQFDGRRDEVVAEARAAGVRTIINIGTDLSSSEKSVQLAERYDCILASVGVHPHDARKLDQSTLDKMRRLAAHRKVVAIGEIGLDFYRDLSPREVQRRAFTEQLELAADLKLPVVIHTRESFSDTIEIVRPLARKLHGGVFHCFPGDIDDAQIVFDLGFVISVGGVTTYRNSRMGRLAAQVSLDKLLLETDSPYLTPVPHRGKVNQPAYVKHVCERVAELREEPFSEVEKITDRACEKLFGLVETFGG